MPDIWEEGLDNMRKKKQPGNVQPSENVNAAQAWEGLKNIGKGLSKGAGFVGKGIGIAAKAASGSFSKMHASYKQNQINRKFKKKGLDIY